MAQILLGGIVLASSVRKFAEKIALSCCVWSNSVLVSGGELARKQGSLLRVRD